MMHFASAINCPPYDKADGFLQITIGCSHGTCKFCSYFKDEFQRLTLEQIEEDVRQIPETFGAPTRIFLQGADAYSASYDVLMGTAELLRRYVPSVRSIGGFARVDSFKDKTVDQLRKLNAAGYEDPYFGIETGCDEVLLKMNKGYTAAEAREQLEKLEEAGMPYVLNYLCGAAGAGRGMQNARDTALLYDGLHPTMLNMTMLTVVPQTPLWDMVAAGEFQEATEMEKLQETQELLRRLTCETVFMNEHASNVFHIACELPAQRDDAIAHIQSVIDGTDEATLRRYREEATKAF